MTDDRPGAIRAFFLARTIPGWTTSYSFSPPLDGRYASVIVVQIDFKTLSAALHYRSCNQVNCVLIRGDERINKLEIIIGIPMEFDQTTDCNLCPVLGESAVPQCSIHQG